MELTRQQLLDELQSLAKQEQEARDNILRIEGAVLVVRHWLAKMADAEAEARKTNRAEMNGQVQEAIVEQT